ncbi:hypothetical protein BN2497_2589 [Janthinobacterium sp. CG23_2]|nr:hypothetical protein BN2497_63 [Janthinobacterium sp. CG23_2]CUI03906.1 hypothetical protein BN2497_2589 [Janthinobacterium sp. CG23_2]CUU26429.1 hypothetical protein BN3177_63 [Janthinobacterium sp. CG23_2]CUU27692.1 hypothetical protein BN3177_2589 [Janthinobacterium sp. CG23_2]
MELQMNATTARKEVVRKWMQQRQAAPAAPPTREEIRRALGWPMLNAIATCAR